MDVGPFQMSFSGYSTDFVLVAIEQVASVSIECPLFCTMSWEVHLVILMAQSLLVLSS